MRVLAVLSLALAVLLAYAQEPFRPADRDRQQIQAKLKALTGAVNALRAAKADDDLLVDVEVCQRAVENILRFPDEFFDQQHVDNTLATLDRGLDRAQQIRAGKSSWAQQKGRVSRAYRSRIDGVPQPYRVIVPDSYDGSRPMPLYVYLHGRGATDFEVNWLAASERPNTPESATDRIQLQSFGRSNNAFHWAGETDVFEAIASVRKRYNIDADRIVLSGFSMGGAGAWHIGLHHPSEFTALEAGAGSTRSNRFGSAQKMSAVQQATMRIYEDSMDCALNIFNLPTIGYGGEIDPQLQASVNVREHLERDGFAFDRQGYTWKARDLRATFLVGPKTGHMMPPAESRKQLDAFVADAAARGRVQPDHIRFVTYTTRYNRSYWIIVSGLEQSYQRAEVDAQRDDSHANYKIKTRNVSRLVLTDVTQARKVSIDGDTFPVRAAPTLIFDRQSGHWKPGGADPEVRKKHGLQGPIDDAFMDAFLCVRPTGQAWNPAVDEHARKELDRFGELFARFFRGDARAKDDAAVTASDIAGANLVLFGDPGSNKLMARVMAKLPIRWTKDSIVLGEKTYSSAEHLLALIYPNPLNPKRYVVLNTGHTAEDRDYKGDYLLPRFGDYAVVKTASGEIVDSGLFDENWKLNR
jgi:pimeloyl-ACP methyl ester carboxylesterase